MNQYDMTMIAVAEKKLWKFFITKRIFWTFIMVM